MASFLGYLATALFGMAMVDTFSVPVFSRLANRGGPHAGLWHLLSEVEAVFGVWACVLLVCMALVAGVGDAVAYIDTRNFTEPAFVFVSMVVAASRPIIALVNMAVRGLARALPPTTEPAMLRSEGRRVGEGCVSQCGSGWWPYHSKKKKKH